MLTLLHLAVATARLCGPGGVRAVLAENLLLKHQLIVLRRARRRAPNLTRSDRLLCGFASLFLNPGRIRKLAIAFRPSTLLAFHQALVRRKVPAAVFIEAVPEQARAERARRGPHPGDHRSQGTQSSIRLSSDCAHHLADVRDRHRQERRVSRVGQTLSPGAGRHRTLVVVVHRPHDEQPLERGSFSMRVDRAPERLGARGHGSVHPSSRRLRRALRRRHRHRRVSRVQRRYSRPDVTSISEYRS